MKQCMCGEYFKDEDSVLCPKCILDQKKVDEYNAYLDHCYSIDCMANRYPPEKPIHIIVKNEEDIDTHYQRKPVCPYCGNEESDAWEIDFGGIEGETEITCGNCEKEYICSQEVTFYYTSCKKEG